MIHKANINKSDRLQRVYELLQSGPRTTMEIIREANVCAVNTIVAELRANGIDIECKHLSKGLFRYRLKGVFL